MCGRRFTADHRAGERQKTCTSRCRKRRRRAQARARRRDELDVYRDDERERQRKSRKRRKATAGATGSEPPSGGPLSRAALAPEVAEIVEVIAQNLKVAAALSRTAFVSQATRIIEQSLAILREPVRDGDAVTRRLGATPEPDLAAVAVAGG